MKKKITNGVVNASRAIRVSNMSALNFGLPWIIAVAVFSHLWTISTVQAQVVERKRKLSF